MKRGLSVVLSAGVALTTTALMAPGSAPAAAPAAPAAQRPAVPAGAPPWLAALRERAVLHLQDGRLVTVGPDPRLSLVPDPSQRDVAGWARRQAQEQAAVQAAAAAAGGATTRSSGGTRPATGRGRIAVTEKEPAGTRGRNDTLDTAERLTSRFGTAKGRKRAVDLSGVQSPAPRPAVERLAPSTEPDSEPETARVTGVSTERGGFGTTGFVGDEPPTPDVPEPEDLDLYALDLEAGQLLDASLKVVDGNLIPLIFLTDADGNFITDSFFDPDLFEPDISVGVPAAGRYYLGVIGFFLISDDPTETGPTTGNYDLTVTGRDGDVDVYSVQLRAGDVLGVSVADAARRITLYDAKGTEVMGSSQDASFIFPENTPMPGGGNALAEVVAPEAGRFFAAVSGGDGPYTASLEVYRPGGTDKNRQTVFLDLDGQRLNTGIFGGRGVTTLSPLSSFLPAWGLKASDRKALGRQIKRTVQENIDADLRRSGLDRKVSVRVVTSDEAADPWGRPGVSRVVVGGTIDESGVFTIGIAQSIDPGNFDREESALVLLDSISEPATPGDPDSPDYSLNFYLTPASDKVAFVGRAIGNVTAHEVGHLVGNWHTDNSNEHAELMDAGGNFALLYGVGPDGAGGTADDVDVDFGQDTFDLFEGFTGIENTLARTTWAFHR